VCVWDNFHEPSVNETLGNLIYHLSRGNEGKRVHFELSAECVCACVWVGERGRGRENGREREKEEVDISIFWGESNCRNTHFKVIPTPQAPESFLKRIRSWLLARKQSKTSSWKGGLPFLLVHFRKNVLTPFRKKQRFLTWNLPLRKLCLWGSAGLSRYRWTLLYAWDRDSKNRLTYNELAYEKTKDKLNKVN
jgi:hypothetical protein